MSREHGTYSKYNTDGCRCDRCKVANTVYRQASRARRLATGQIHHGRTSGYDCGCRCAECSKAKSESDLHRRERGEP